jgi:hypothetical protein
LKARTSIRQATRCSSARRPCTDLLTGRWEQLCIAAFSLFSLRATACTGRWSA